MLSGMVSDALAARLAGAGRPLMLGGDVGASLRASGVSGHLGRLLREGGDDPHLHGDALARHYAVEIAAGADVLTTLRDKCTNSKAWDELSALMKSALTDFAKEFHAEEPAKKMA